MTDLYERHEAVRYLTENAAKLRRYLADQLAGEQFELLRSLLAPAENHGLRIAREKSSMKSPMSAA